MFWSTALFLAVDHKFDADATDCDDGLATLWIATEQPAKPEHMDIERMLFDDIILSPDKIDEFPAAKHDIGRVHQESQQLELNRRKMMGLPGDPHFTTSRIQFNVPGAHDRMRLGHPRRAPEQGPDLRHEQTGTFITDVRAVHAVIQVTDTGILS